MLIILYILLVIAIILEGTIVSLPLVLITLLCMTIIKKDSSVFIVAFVAGILLDVFSLRQLGGTSIFFLVFLFLVLLYQRKYEIYSYPFVLAGTFIGSAVFLYLFKYDNVLEQAGISVIVSFIIFACIRLFVRYQSSRPTPLHYHA